MTLEGLLNPVLESLNQHLSTKSVIGEAVTIGDITLIPVMDMMFGFGAGGGEGTAAANAGVGGGAGAGGRLSPKAVIVIKGDDVQVLPLSKGSAIEKIVDSIPGLLEKFQASKKEEPKD